MWGSVMLSECWDASPKGWSALEYLAERSLVLHCVCPSLGALLTRHSLLGEAVLHSHLVLVGAVISFAGVREKEEKRCISISDWFQVWSSDMVKCYRRFSPHLSLNDHWDVCVWGVRVAHINISYPLKKFLLSEKTHFRREMERSREIPFLHALSLLEDDMGKGRGMLVWEKGY